MLGSALLQVAQALGIMLFSAVTIVAVWAICGVLFCAVTCGFSCGCCEACKAARRWLTHSHGLA